MWESKDWKGGRRRDSGRWRVAVDVGFPARREEGGGRRAGRECLCLLWASLPGRLP